MSHLIRIVLIIALALTFSLIASIATVFTAPIFRWLHLHSLSLSEGVRAHSRGSFWLSFLQLHHSTKRSMQPAGESTMPLA